MTRWWRDTLFRRLFLLMWVALVASHFVAYGVVTGWRGGVTPTFGSLPPTPGVPQVPPAPLPGARPMPMPPPPGNAHGPGGPPGHRGPPPERAGPMPMPMPTPGPDATPPPRPMATAPAGFGGALPWASLLLDYGVRALLIGLAAWFGAAWLARPMQRLAGAAGTLGAGLARQAPLPVLDDTLGTVEVRETARVFNTMATQLQTQFRARGLMMAAISHDLRTPLTRMRLRLEQLAEGGSEPARRCIADVHDMDALIDTALQVFRDLDQTEPRQPVDVQALVSALADDLAEQGRPVTFEGPPLVATLAPQSLRRALDNLVQNALRYGGGARIALQPGNGTLVLTVNDDGPGIPPADLAAVFEPFHRLDASRSRHSGGAGLGLYIARELAQRHGGRLTLANRPEGGLMATLEWPTDASAK